MKIERVIEYHRRDFTAVYMCEHCGHSHEGSGYDDTYFHEHVVPEMVCRGCGEQSNGASIPMKPRYPDGLQL